MKNRTSLAITEKHGSVLEVASDVACVQDIIVNLYFIGEPNAGDRGWTLIDAGLFGGAAARIRQAAEERFGAGARPSAIILTHGHFDHIGAVIELANEWNVPVYAHPLEMPYLTGQSSYPPPDPTVGGGAMARLSFMYPRKPIDLGDRVRTLPEDGSVPAMTGWRFIHTPGHTAGHISLFRDADRVLIAGDAFVTVRQESALAVLTQKPEVRRPPAYYTPDWEAARRSVIELAALRPEMVATGHGLPMRGSEMRMQLEELARDFDRLAVPAHGRYVNEPAVTDETGVVSVPPPAADPLPKVFLGVGLAALVGALVLRSSGRSQPKPQGQRKRRRRRTAL